MVACKVIFTVAFVLVAAVQIQGAPSTDTEWSIPFFDEFKNITSQMSNIVSDNSQYAKNGITTFVDGFKSELALFSKTVEGKSGVSDMVKEATKQWQNTIETYTKDMPKEIIGVKEFKEKAEQTLKNIVEHATEISKKAQGNTEVEKLIREFTKKNIDIFMDSVKTVKAKIESKVA